MYSVGIDVGGTFLKAAVLVDGSLKVVRRPIPDFLSTSSNARELDPYVLVAAVDDLLEQVIPSEGCDRIFITGQMAGLAFVDERGSAVAPVMSWQDTRYSDVAAAEQQIPASELQRLGDGLRIGLPLVSLAAGAAPRGAFVTSLLGYVAGALIGERCSYLHATDAAAFGMLHVASCDWSEAALQAAHLLREQLPQPVASVMKAGSSPRFRAAVMTPVGDQQAALLGAGLDESRLSMNIATGCQVSRLTHEPSSPAQLRPFFGGNFLQTVTHLPAGRLLASAVGKDTVGEVSGEDWPTALRRAADADSAVGQAVSEIAAACVSAARRLDPNPSAILFSGGVAQKIPVLRDQICAELGVRGEVYPGDDAALEGLRVLQESSSPLLGSR